MMYRYQPRYLAPERVTFWHRHPTKICIAAVVILVALMLTGCEDFWGCRQGWTC